MGLYMAVYGMCISDVFFFCKQLLYISDVFSFVNNSCIFLMIFTSLFTGYYADSIRRVCEPCDMQCKSCVPGNPTACVSCLDGYFLKDHQCVMSSECQTRYYTNTTTGKCDLCPATCSFCDSADYCSACFLNYFLTPDHKCVEKCPSGTYALDRRTTWVLMCCIVN